MRKVVRKAGEFMQISTMTDGAFSKKTVRKNGFQRSCVKEYAYQLSKRVHNIGRNTELHFMF